LASTRPAYGSAAALLLVLSAAGCERSPNTNSSAKPPAHSGVANVQSATTNQATETPRKYIAYYFHRTVRCPTCLSIEKQSQEAIEGAYTEELSAGRLEWRAVNIEEPGNEHFEKDFALQSQSLVIVEMTGERVTRWKLLPQVWELVEDPYGFREYVVREVAAFLGGG
jgi:hypothetical protein